MARPRAGLFVIGYLAIQLGRTGDCRPPYGGVIAGHRLPGHRSPFSSDSQVYAEHLLERSGDGSRLVAVGNGEVPGGEARRRHPLG